MSAAELTKAPVVEVTRCTGCGRCVAACRLGLFTLEVSGFRKHALLRNGGRCAGCLECLGACPVGALKREGEGGQEGDPHALPP